MNKKIFLLLAMIILTPATLAISEPDLLNTFDVLDYCGNNINYDAEAWSNYTAFACPENPIISSAYIMQVYNSQTGALIFNQTHGYSGTSTSTELRYDGGYIFVSDVNDGQIFDVSNPGFIERLPWVNCPGLGQDGSILWANTGENIYFTQNGQTSIIKWNETSCISVGSINFAPTSDTLSDRDNKVYSRGGNLYSYTDSVNGDYPDTNSDVLLYSVPAGKATSSFRDWNRNPNNPIWVTDKGYFITVGGSSYDDFASTSLNQNTGEVQVFGDTDNLVSINTDGTFYLSDYTDFSAPIHQNTTIEANSDTDIFRYVLDRFVTKNLTDDTFRVWSIPPPDFSIITPEANTEPQIELEFIGVDTSGNFVFLSTLEDNEGGRVYYDLEVNKYPEDVTAGTLVINEIDFTSEDDLSLIDAGICNEYLGIGSSSGNIQFDSDGYLFSDQTNVSCISDLIFNLDQVTSLDTDSLFIDTSIGLEDGLTSFSVVNSAGNRVFLYYLEIDSVSDTYNFSYFDGSSEQFIITNGALSGNDYFTLSINLSFASDQYDYTLFDEFGGTLVSGTHNALIDVEDVKDYRFNEFSDQIDLIIDYASFSYIGGEFNPSYTLYDSLDPGVPLVKSLRETITKGFGVYIADLYATDETLGLDYADNFESIEVFYTEDTPVLSEEDIALAVNAKASEVAGVGGFISGDLFTDTVNNYLIDLGFISTASKIFLAFVAIMIGIFLGHSYGTIGSFAGGLGGMFLSYYVGWLPGWIVITLVLSIVLFVAFEARKAISGGS